MGPPEATRSATLVGQLARIGFVEPVRADALLHSPPLDALLVGDGAPGVVDAASNDEGQLLTGFAAAAEPDAALRGLGRILEATDRPASLLAALRSDPLLRSRLIAVLGSSVAFADHLARHSGQVLELADPSLAQRRPSAYGLRTALLGAVAGRVGADALDALRVAYRRHLLSLAARDLCADVPVDAVAGELADLAGAALEAALAVARTTLPAGAAPCRLAVIGMGKCGGRELNYVSDVDVLFVAEPEEGADEQAALRTATTLASGLIRGCSAHTAEGALWPVDTTLRPEGRNGPLVRTLDSHLAYYRSWARTWEFQALLKARPVAGDLDLGRRFVAGVAPLVWQAGDREGFVDDVRGMRRRVERQLGPSRASRELKLGPGGLRDIEFAVQLLQLVHGRTDPSLRSPTTLVALSALSASGYVGRGDGAKLDEAYRFLRALEHRIQLHRLRRTHVVPDTDPDRRRLGRSLGFRRDPVEELEEAWRGHAREIRRLHEKLFYRPLLTAVARLPGHEAGLPAPAARARLEALGYADPAGALLHLEALTDGMTRRAAIQRTLLPVMLGWFADGPDPDAGLLGFRRVSEALGTTPWYLRLLRDEGSTAERTARLLASSRYATDLLLRAPEAVRLLADDADLVPRSHPEVAVEMLAGGQRHDDPVAAMAAVRAVRRRELLRIAAADIAGLLDVSDVGASLTAVARATLVAALSVAVRAVAGLRGASLPCRVAVVGMGRLGGQEMTYGSDADVLFVHDPLPGASDEDANEAALAVANQLRRLLSAPGPDPAFVIDPDLRPEGRQGPVVRSLASYEAYYTRWAQVWERQALLRAAPVAGDEDLLGRFDALIDPLRWSPAGLDTADVREIRRIKARVEAERLPRGADRSTHLKLGPGGLADVEWTAQLLQLRHAGSVPALRTTSTIPALRAATDAGLLDGADRDVLVDAWRWATRVRNAVVLVRGRVSDQVPTGVRDLAALSRFLGYEPGAADVFLDNHRRMARRARRVVERVFYAG